MNRSWSPLACRRFETPLGPMIAALGADGIAGLWFVDQRHYPDMSRWPGDRDERLLDAVREQTLDYLAGERRSFDLPLDLSRGTTFQQAVWRAMLEIPYGATSSYGRIAAGLGRPRATRAVGAAVGRNPISLVVPCHRVYGHGDAPTGYAGGLPRKSALRRLETGLALSDP